jgi:hypothetical protein
MKLHSITKSCTQAAIIPFLLMSNLSNAESPGYEQSLSLQGITFKISCPNHGSLNKLTIVPSGLEIDNPVIEKDIDGSVTGAEIGDINSDGSPEIYIYVHSAGSGAYGDVVAYSANNKKSLSGIYLPPLTDDKKNSAGYMGHDEFTLVENVLARRFPVYKQGDANANATGGMRDLTYKLTQGEASWVLKLDQSTDFSGQK